MTEKINNVFDYKSHARGMGIKVDGLDDSEITQKIIDFRLQQKNASRLAEYITGLRPDNPEMVDRLVEDQKIIREKYELPPIDLKWSDYSLYEEQLRTIAKKNSVKIRPRNERQRLFENAKVDGKPRILGGYHEDDSLFVDLEKDSKTYPDDILDFEHELIHTLQYKRYPEMPVEVREYEAYVAGYNTQGIIKHPNLIGMFIFGMNIYGSVMWGYNQLQEEPVWKNPNHFLEKIDHIKVLNKNSDR